MKQKIESTKAPAAIGPYSQAIATDGLIFVSGQLPINAETGSNPKLNGYTENGYKDSTIEVTISSGHKFNCDYWVADIMIQDPS